jgi:cytoskeleton protein RodZ
MAEIGATLREARMRARIDVSEIEAQTKIRAKYLRALENEEWDLLPGPTFVKSFLRTYGQALGLDGRALVEEYKLHHEHPGEGAELSQQPTASAPRRTRPRGGTATHRRAGAKTAARPPAAPGRPSRGYMAAVSAVGLAIVVLVYALLSGGGSPAPTTAGAPPRASRGAHSSGADRAARGAGATAPLASLKVEPSGEIYVCLIGDGRQRIPGVILTAASALPTYHARRFELTLGNDAATLVVNGRPQAVPASAQPIGYSITRAGTRPLAAGEQPTCK